MRKMRRTKRRRKIRSRMQRGSLSRKARGITEVGQTVPTEIEILVVIISRLSDDELNSLAAARHDD